jgi:hypothetical protein
MPKTNSQNTTPQSITQYPTQAPSCCHLRQKKTEKKEKKAAAYTSPLPCFTTPTPSSPGQLYCRLCHHDPNRIAVDLYQAVDCYCPCITAAISSSSLRAASLSPAPLTSRDRRFSPALRREDRSHHQLTMTASIPQPDSPLTHCRRCNHEERKQEN